MLDLVRRHGEVTRAEVTQACDLAPPSISRIVEALSEHQLLVLGDKVIKGRGQPSARLMLRTEAAYGVGLSIMTDALSGAVMNLGGEIVATDSVRLGGFGVEDVLAGAAVVYASLLARARIEPRQVCGVGGAVTGFFLGQGRRVNPPDPLGALSGVDLDRLLADRLSRPVWVDNDGNAAAMGEALNGVGRRHGGFAYIYFAMGIGGAVVINGQVFSGAFGNAGEFGGVFSPQDYEERPTLEFLRLTLARHGQHFPDIATMVDRFDLTLPGVEPWIVGVLPKLDLLASAIAAVVDPEVIVLGGRIPLALGEELARRMGFYTKPRHGTERPFPQIVAGEVKGDATAIGAAAIPLKSVFFR